ncbi:MAG: hypothetical protein HOO06_14755 [Bdellovibrionaceae bacterium]|mgnify:CR=1 FL=1|jgi:hypothetical protein|nr:hypothetical protein [Pseudobdellovibrionaceae bacterium]
MKKFVFAAGFYILMGLFGGFLTVNSWDSMIYFYTQDGPEKGRFPAAIRRSYDFSSLKGVALNRAAKERLLLDARIISDKARLGIELGHFVKNNKEGYKELACHTYSQIELTFTASNMAVSGKRPVMKIQAPCEVAENYNRIKTIWIPTHKLMQTKGKNFDQKFFEEQVSFKFDRVFHILPTQWSLQQLRLYNDASDVKDIVITENEVRNILRSNFTISFLDVQE